MAVAHRLRLRRSAAQLHALVQVEREIRAADSLSRRKYLREFSEAYQTYERVLSDHEAHSLLLAADVTLLADYHALPKCQRYAGELVETLATVTGRPVILGVETVFASDQPALDAWMRREIGEQELRARIRFDAEWGYEWRPFYSMLSVARLHAAEIVALDCMPRGDLRRIGVRDRHAAGMIAAAHQRRPEALIVVLFGESHLAPTHLPELVKSALPSQRVLTVLQNVDPLYWRAAGERENVRTVQVAPDVLCVFNSTPLEKYESYRLCIDRWRQTRPIPQDVAPTLLNLVDALARFLNLKDTAELVLPQIYSRSTFDEIRSLLAKDMVADAEQRDILRRIAEKGIAYSRRLNAVFAAGFQVEDATEEAARYLHAACGAVPHDAITTGVEDDGRFYGGVLEEALAHFGSRVFYPGRKSVRDVDLFQAYGQSPDEVEQTRAYSYADYMQMIDFLVTHRDYEANLRQYWQRPELLEEGLAYTGDKFAFITKALGQLMGSDLYDAYVAGKVTRRSLRALFTRDFSAPGAARTAYFVIARRLRRGRTSRH